MLEPVLGTLLVDHDLRGPRLRVVAADRLDHAAVTRRALIGDDDAPDRVLLAPHAGESDSYGHKRPGSLAGVFQMDRAVGEGVAPQKPQIDADVRRKRALAAANDHRADVEIYAIDQAGRKRGCRQARAADAHGPIGHKIRAELALEPRPLAAHRLERA